MSDLLLVKKPIIKSASDNFWTPCICIVSRKVKKTVPESKLLRVSWSDKRINDYYLLFMSFPFKKNGKHIILLCNAKNPIQKKQFIKFCLTFSLLLTHLVYAFYSSFHMNLSECVFYLYVYVFDFCRQWLRHNICYIYCYICNSYIIK